MFYVTCCQFERSTTRPCVADTVCVCVVDRLTLKEQNNVTCLQMLCVVWLSALVGIVYQYVFHERCEYTDKQFVKQSVDCVFFCVHFLSRLVR